MAPTTKAKGSAEKPAKRARSTGGGKKKLTAFNLFMKTEMARLKETEPDMTHKDRFKQATENWKNSPKNPKNSS
ncbi:hypothetical protein CC1G_06617 [Coprinopsis cinerea okayama7|uniref:YABBY protein C-terminal domain-containing protein n=1 Tax=Coprinopsis cinerea (strain Okayama-7 / 130 / ATCC MYA-4618 / FGSC 9003) TaxID=240176 RepID=A8N2Y2_COPC7|nr:hypothetical protein CC1G_06617 [Coprinopsis cinerea okayama7\|eukprot:XP_001829280.1 hypothetical protein CC1G_06617 [Coprinopsis cinerea okayama7\